MFILFGFGHRTIKNFGMVDEQACGHCNNKVQRHILKITTWFTLFFIPIIPYKREYLMVCPICKQAHTLDKEQFEALTSANENSEQVLNQVIPDQAAFNEQNKYAGKTETQIAYLKQMEELKKLKEQRG